jgi:uncharacterized protein
MSTKQQGVSQETLTEHMVMEYLHKHPDFFVAHANLLTDISIPHQTHGAVSLVEHQVATLRDKNRELKRQLQILVEVARDNDRLNERVQRLTLTLLESTRLDVALEAIKDCLGRDLRADHVVLGLFLPQIPTLEISGLTLLSLSREDEGAAAYATLIAGGKPLCGHLRRQQTQYLFGQNAEQIASAVALSLIATDEVTQEARCMGLLAIGSYDPDRYHAGMGILFLSYLGELIGRVLWRHWPRH